MRSLDVVVVADRLHVLTVLILTHVSDQQHVPVRYVARVLARVCVASQPITRFNDVPYGVYCAVSTIKDLVWLSFAQKVQL